MAKILNLEWMSFSARDRNIASLIANYLRFHGHEVYEESVFRGAQAVHNLRPDLVYFTDITGAKINYNVARYAKESGSLLVSYVAEGTPVDKILETETYAWGNNSSKKMIEDLNIVWSPRMKRSFDRIKGEPEKIKIVGGVGFDIYVLNPPPSRQELLKKYNKDGFKKVIGVGLWDFGFIEEGDNRAPFFHNFYKAEDINRIRKDGKEFNRILREVVLQNPDILFILKEHPGTQLGDSASGIEGLRGLANTLVLKREEHVFPLIAVSDFWLVYDSTTCLEGWIMDKQSLLLNPSGTDFLRSEIYQGSPHVDNSTDLQRAIDVFYEKGTLPGFSEKASERQEIIEKMITYADGLNHVRAGNAILDLLEGKTNRPVPSPKLADPVLLKEFAKTKLPIIKDRSFFGKKAKGFSVQETKDFAEKLYGSQINFYQNLGLSKYQLRKISAATGDISPIRGTLKP